MAAVVRNWWSPRPCAGGTRRQDRCDGIASRPSRLLSCAPYPWRAFSMCSMRGSSPRRVLSQRWRWRQGTASGSAESGSLRPNQRGNLMWTSRRPFSSLRLESVRQCPMCGSRTAWGRLLLREGLQTFGPLCGPQEWWKCLTREFLRLGRIAQLVEQLTLNQRVLGSSPSAPTNSLFLNLAGTPRAEWRAVNATVRGNSMRR